MANIQTRTTADNRVMYTARIRIKGFPQQIATFSRLTDAKQWVQKTEARIREGMHFSKAEAKRHTFTEMVQRYTRTVLTNKSATIQYIQFSIFFHANRNIATKFIAVIKASRKT